MLMFIFAIAFVIVFHDLKAHGSQALYVMLCCFSSYLIIIQISEITGNSTEQQKIDLKQDYFQT